MWIENLRNVVIEDVRIAALFTGGFWPAAGSRGRHRKILNPSYAATV